MTTPEAVFYIGVALIVLVGVGFMTLINKNKTITVEYTLPEGAEENIQKIIQAYATLERVKSGSVSAENLGEVYQEAQILVIANTRERLATIGNSIQTLEKTRGRHLEIKLMSQAADDATSIGKLEAEQTRLLQELEELTQSEPALA